jgi:hypothetical protein
LTVPLAEKLVLFDLGIGLAVVVFKRQSQPGPAGRFSADGVATLALVSIFASNSLASKMRILAAGQELHHGANQIQAWIVVDRSILSFLDRVCRLGRFPGLREAD